MTGIVTDVKEGILLSYQEMLADPYHRYRSWEHCFSFFHRHYPFMSEDQLDAATLHLAFYLASWGMYRGSSKLLQKNYKVHTSILKIVSGEKYAPLTEIDFDSTSSISQITPLIFDLVRELQQAYAGLDVSPTDTLVTKVLLGTLGCIPAYDRWFVDGVKLWGDALNDSQNRITARLGRNSYLGLINFYRQHKQYILAAQALTAENGFKYPIMKLIDMYFWNLGYQMYGNTSDKY